MQVVRIDKKGRVIDGVVSVSKRDHGPENLTWIALGNDGPWKITFDKGTGSPFTEVTYTVDAGGATSTDGGPVNGVVGRTYRYSVRHGLTDELTDDPDVDVEP